MAISSPCSCFTWSSFGCDVDAVQSTLYSSKIVLVFMKIIWVKILLHVYRRIEYKGAGSWTEVCF